LTLFDGIRRAWARRKLWREINSKWEELHDLPFLFTEERRQQLYKEIADLHDKLEKLM
jgi:hypothetical protein